MTTAMGVRVPDGVVRWARWSVWLTTALVVVQLAAFAGLVARVRGAFAVMGVAAGVSVVVALVVAVRLIGLRERLFPGRTMMQASREAIAGRGRLLRGGPFTAPDDGERLAWWHLTSDTQSLWGAAFAVGLLGGNVLDERHRLVLTGGHVVWLVLMVLVVAGFALLLRNSVRLRRAAESVRRESGTLEP